MHCLYGGYNLHRFSDALGLVLFNNGLILFAMAAEHNLYTTDSIERGRQFCMFSCIFPFFGRHVITHRLRDKDIKASINCFCHQMFQAILKYSKKIQPENHLVPDFYCF